MFNRSSVIDQAEAAGELASKCDVSRHRHRLEQRQILVDEDTAVIRVVHHAGTDGSAEQAHLPAVGGLDTRQDPDECRLARTVLSEQSVYLSRFDNEVDVFVGRERTEVLGDRSKFQLHESQT